MDALAKRLQARLAELDSGHDARTEASGTVDLDQARTGRLTRMDALQQQAMAQASNRRAQLEKQRIRGALQRIESGEYGYCLRCEEPIGVGRLEADPSVTFCIECARAED
ncbi:TraR/DksA family transcriptional regulator [Thiohalorhabdus sp. Cl-TMA]|uniref:TraR/DksA family transcriptional regulator n=1 Tax=Thiohalorhabdus methylotrophus TaxID=3242694 RepID=A0ABV4TTK3_9GAMM